MAFKKRTIIKISLTVLTFLVLLLVFGYYNLSAKYDLLVDQSNIESKLLQNQFDEILKKYDSLNLVIEKNEVAEVEKVVVAAQENKAHFLSTTWDINHENKSLEYKINLLKSKINEDSNEIIKINTILTQNKKELAELVSHKKNEYVGRHENLNAINLNARGVKILSDLYSKNREGKIQQIRVCFTLEGNEFVRNGNKQLYVQVVNPKNQIISVKDTHLETNNLKLTYSAKTEAMYTKKDLDVCTYVDLEADKTIKGKYIINVYNSFCKIGSTIFEYE
ncbi:MAG: hypothetical protein CMP76_03545 [Flavobacterium sp.]|uniref:hypothetical protein n=1 Tax=Flavobacterium sp. TaxID=239 RepID=UPI000C63C9E9|nr:hypothetical protein [Flavobacterium sp.]MBF02350.1 hypothetical protein [Flavobacterium sp.]|tara:strand:+ start:510 stop:1343 length:834 start_codon:yes stop_codon:yes gene_type:complete